MKIRLKTDLPYDKMHGTKQGCIFDVTRTVAGIYVGYIFRAKSDSLCFALKSEADIVAG